MNTTQVEELRVILGLSYKEVSEVCLGKTREAMFALYMAAQNHKDESEDIFKRCGFDMHTPISPIRGYVNLYQLIMKNDFDMRNDMQLFLFICRHIRNGRELKDGELF